MFIRYEIHDIGLSGTEIKKASSHFSIPQIATHAMLQAETGTIRYTMDDVTQPSVSVGMRLPPGKPVLFLIENIKRMRFCNESALAGKLHIHYLAPREP